jgi:hypothetical protein
MMVAPVVVELDEPNELDLDALVFQPSRLSVQCYVNFPTAGEGDKNSINNVAPTEHR